MPDDIKKELENTELEDVDTDDYFEKVLNEDLKEPTDDDTDAGAETSDKKDAESDEGTKAAKPSYEELEAKLAKMEKEAKGRLSDVVKSRQDKASIKSELNELRSAVSELLSKRKSVVKEEPKKTPLESTEIGIKFREDDSAYVDLSEVKEKIEAETQLTKRELEALKLERAKEQAAKAFQESVSNVINEDSERFNPAYETLKEAYKDLNDAVIAMQIRTNTIDQEDGTIDQDTALDMLAGSEEEKLFLEKHPGLDPTRVARAFNTKVDLRTSLRHIADVRGVKSKEAGEPTLDEKIQAAKNKPSGLGRQENQSGGSASLVERISSLGTDEILDFSDAEAEKIEAMLAREALKGD